ncbi:MAG TPA: twin-arginine translocase subunit TatC [Acidimicrobiales bacterium]|nr:twin-arginine translocase subunit TatC [Acidimicrobiales bacterium]
MRLGTTRRNARATPDAMTIAGHLIELRRRFLIATASVAVMGVVAFVLYNPLFSFLVHPYCVAFPHHCKLNAFSPLDNLTLRFKIAGYGGLLFASPIVLWEFWRFITPGLKHDEKRYAIPFVLASIVLFLIGCGLAYWSFEHALVFLKNIGGNNLQSTYGANQYLSLLLLVMFLYGITFIFPVILTALELVGVLSSAQLLHWWRPAVIIITCAAALFTPTGDPLSMIFLMIPLIVFYFASILAGRLLGK